MFNKCVVIVLSKMSRDIVVVSFGDYYESPGALLIMDSPDTRYCVLCKSMLNANEVKCDCLFILKH